MKNNSSDKIVNDQLEKLKHLRRYKAPSDLYQNVLNQVEGIVATIPTIWVWSAAAVLIVLFGVELLFVLEQGGMGNEEIAGELMNFKSNQYYNE